MSKKKSLLMALALVLVAGLSITAGTFAYFQWTTGEDQRTSVNVTIETGGITMHIEPEQTGFVGLYPTAHCENNVRYGDTLVTIVNNTGTLAIPSFKLKVKVTKGGSGELTSEALSHLNYTVVPIKTMKDADGNPVKDLDNTTFTCSTIPTGSDKDDAGNILFSNADEWLPHLDFGSVSTEGEWSHIPTTSDKMSNASTLADGYLPRQYYVSGSKVGEVAGITFRGEAYSTTYQYYRVYVWMDEEYTTTIIGNDVTDPLQNAQISVTWSEESVVQQVSGESNVETVPLAPGLYSTNETLISTWAELEANGDITVEDNVIIASNNNLEGILSIPDEITGISDDHASEDAGAFRNSKISEVRFGVNSQLTMIGYMSFIDSSLTKIEIPANVTYISMNVFTGCNLGNGLTFAKNSKLTALGSSALSSAGLTSLVLPEGLQSIAGNALYANDFTSIEIPASVTNIDYSAFGYCESLNTIRFKGTVDAWNAITKDESWNVEVPATKVICSDGEVTL